MKDSRKTGCFFCPRRADDGEHCIEKTEIYFKYGKRREPKTPVFPFE